MRKVPWLAELLNAMEGGVHLSALCFVAFLCLSRLLGPVFLSVFLAGDNAVTSQVAVALGFVSWRFLLVENAPRPKSVGRAAFGWLLWAAGSYASVFGPGVTSEPTVTELVLATVHYCGVFGVWGGACFRVAFGPGSWRQWLCYGAWVAIGWGMNVLRVLFGGFPFAAAHPVAAASSVALSAFTWSVTVVLWCQDHGAADRGHRLVMLRPSASSVRCLASAVSVLLILNDFPCIVRSDNVR